MMSSHDFPASRLFRQNRPGHQERVLPLFRPKNAKYPLHEAVSSGINKHIRWSLFLDVKYTLDDLMRGGFWTLGYYDYRKEDTKGRYVEDVVGEWPGKRRVRK